MMSSTFAFTFLVFFLVIKTSVTTQTHHRGESISRNNELYEIRIYESAPPGTKATFNEAFDRQIRELKNCFAHLDTDVDWIEFDPARLVFETVAEIPVGQQSSQPATLHLMCTAHKMRSIHFAVHITRRNRHPPKFSAEHFHFYAPIGLGPGLEVGRLQVVDHDPIIYNSQIQFRIVQKQSSSSEDGPSQIGQQLSTDLETHWQIHKNGSLNVARPMTDLRLYQPYSIRLLAIDFGSPQLFSLADVTIVPVSVSQPQNIRVNVANKEYQVFEWELPTYGVPESFKLEVKKEQMMVDTVLRIDPTERITMTEFNLPIGIEYTVTVVAVDIDGETPSQPHSFTPIEAAPQCQGTCSPTGGVPMCYYARNHEIEQYRDQSGRLHCLCYDGYSSAQCDTIESCLAERVVDVYGGVDWPETSVNASTSLLCPYNSDAAQLERRCVWDDRKGVARWANASEGDNQCRTQSSVLTHLGVLANYARRADLTVSGLQAVQRYLDSILQFPAFDPHAKNTHFDIRIAEHVTQILDIVLTARNFSAIPGTGNSTRVRAHLFGYLAEFTRRLPIPHTVQTTSGGLHLRSWELATPSADDLFNRVTQQNDPLVVDLGRDCRVRLSPRLGPATTRAVCLRNSTLLPLLDGRTPILSVELERRGIKAENNNELNMGQSVNNEKVNNEKSSEDTTEDGATYRFPPSLRLPEGVKILVGLRPRYFGYEEFNLIRQPPNPNYTCALYDHNLNHWTISGITVLSRDFDNGFVLCESDFVGAFALLPEWMFQSDDSLFQSAVNVLPAATAAIVMISACVLLTIALIQRESPTDPALAFFLIAILLLHLAQLIANVPPLANTLVTLLNSHHSPVSLDQLIYLCLHFALVSVGASLTLLNASLHSRIVQIECNYRQLTSRCSRLFTTLVMALVIPLAMCSLTWLFDGYVFKGLTSKTPVLLPFNWPFILALLMPLVLFVGCAMGYGAYSFYYAGSVAGTINNELQINDLQKRRLLHDFASAAGLSLLVLMFVYPNAIVFTQAHSSTRNLTLSVLHLAVALVLFLFTALHFRVQHKMPYCGSNAVTRRGPLENPFVPLELGKEDSGKKAPRLSPTKRNGNGIHHNHRRSPSGDSPNGHLPQQPNGPPVGRFTATSAEEQDGGGIIEDHHRNFDKQLLLERRAILAVADNARHRHSLVAFTDDSSLYGRRRASQQQQLYSAGGRATTSGGFGTWRTSAVSRQEQAQSGGRLSFLSDRGESGVAVTVAGASVATTASTTTTANDSMEEQQIQHHQSPYMSQSLHQNPYQSFTSRIPKLTPPIVQFDAFDGIVAIDENLSGNDEDGEDLDAFLERPTTLQRNSNIADYADIPPPMLSSLYLPHRRQDAATQSPRQKSPVPPPSPYPPSSTSHPLVSVV